MSIPYNLNIPAATHNPSVDQPNMETNNNNIATYVAVDHVSFNAGPGDTSGRHLQVSFDSNNVPGLPTPLSGIGNRIGILFTNTVGVGTIDQLFYYTGTATDSANQYFIGASGGSVLLLGGIIVKWGTVLNAPDNTPINFATNSGAAFPNNCFAVFPAILKANTSNPVNVTVRSFTASNFIVRISFQSGGTTTQDILYVAIGN